MIIWGGYQYGPGLTEGPVGDGARYNPLSDTWTPITNVGAPGPRYVYTPVWTGSEMIIWGGAGVAGFFDGFGVRYNPSSDTWKSISSAGAPSARGYNTAVWTGNEMIIWGGGDVGGNLLSDGGLYNPVADLWTPTIANGVPRARHVHTAVWTGSAMIIWSGSSASYLGSGTTDSVLNDTFSYTVATGPDDTTPPVLTLPANITTDATSPSGAVVTYTVSARDLIDGPVVASCVLPSGSFFPIGTSTVSCQASDSTGNTAYGNFQIVVQAAPTQISNLVATIISFNLANGITKSLVAKLNSALAALTQAEREGSVAACNMLGAFVNEVQAQSGKQVTTAEAKQLIASANRIRAAMGCL